MSTTPAVKPPPVVSDLDVAFPVGDFIAKVLPLWPEIPKEFKASTPWEKQASKWFYSGPDMEWVNRIEPREGVDKRNALRAIQALLGSFEPKHEHKMAGAAFLLASWFTDPELKAAP